MRSNWLRTGLPSLLLSTFVVALLLILPFISSAESHKWQGVDESVVQRVAAEHGRKATSPLINTDQGDLLLFLFLLAGAGGGFAAGYFWRALTEQKKIAKAKDAGVL
jgi:hypothetical protein